MLHFQYDPNFSRPRSQQRLDHAERILGKMVVRRIVAFVLYLLGADFQAIARILAMSQNTVKSILRRTWQEGLAAFEDRRRRTSTFLPITASGDSTPPPTVRVDENYINVVWSAGEILPLPKKNTIQCRTVLLTLLAANKLSRNEVSKALELSSERTRKLTTALMKHDVAALIDQRRGQQHDYRVTPDRKAELIQQFVLNLSASASTSCARLSKDLKERCKVELNPRTIGIHLAKLGLPEIRNTLAESLQTVKKTSAI